VASTRWRRRPTLGHVDRDGQAMLFKDPALGLKEAAREKRNTMPRACAKLVRDSERGGRLSTS
jgi:hypothetical protein